MGLAESINKYNVPRGIDAVLTQLDIEQQLDLRTALINPNVGNVAISRALRDHGYEASEASVRRWRERNLTTVNGL